MNEVWALREKRSSKSLVPAATNVQLAATTKTPSSASYPFELPERRSTLRALIDEFRRGEHQLHRGLGADASSWADTAPARGQLLKAPEPPHYQPQQSTMKKSASVWYAAPPAPDRPLVSRMSMPNLRSGSNSDRRQNPQELSGPIHEWQVYQLMQCCPRIFSPLYQIDMTFYDNFAPCFTVDSRGWGWLQKGNKACYLFAAVYWLT